MEMKRQDVRELANSQVRQLMHRTQVPSAVLLEARRSARVSQLREVLERAKLVELAMDQGTTLDGDSLVALACWAEATVYLLEEHDGSVMWEPPVEPCCWKIAIRSSDESGWRHGLTARAWHRARYRDTVLEQQVPDGDLNLLSYALAELMEGQGRASDEIDAELREAEQRALDLNVLDMLARALQARGSSRRVALD